MSAIARFAANLRKRNTRKPSEFRAADWKATPRAVGTLKSVVEQVAAEIARQDALSAKRKIFWPTYQPIVRLRQIVADHAAFRQTLNTAKPFASIGSTSEGTYRVGELRVVIRQGVSTDWDRYSKAWHRAHGPARTYSTTIVVSQWTGRAVRTVSYAQTRLQNMDRRAVEAVAAFLNLPKLRGKAGLRIDSHVELAEVPSPSKRCRVYERRLAGACLGYVATRRDQHYHDSTIAGACAGVTEKIARARLARQHRAASGALGFDTEKPLGVILRGLGFCRDGTADALEMLGLSDRKYDVGELIQAGQWSHAPAVARKYPAEVATIAAALATARLPASLANLLRRFATA